MYMEIYNFPMVMFIIGKNGNNNHPKLSEPQSFFYGAMLIIIIIAAYLTSTIHLHVEASQNVVQQPRPPPQPQAPSPQQQVLLPSPQQPPPVAAAGPVVMPGSSPVESNTRSDQQRDEGDNNRIDLGRVLLLIGGGVAMAFCGCLLAHHVFQHFQKIHHHPRRSGSSSPNNSRKVLE
ncbi:hypothetical protein FOZ61_009162 [Perkinsus olseni]|uniref:Uncharacterized protein n=1 Tax=Perkinsus olseni TaxID=32597 RepID=A0A7J6L1V7_PEROL|nr:hypothetical protein FOZ61_009162 [Perkinsus olseni]